MDWPGGAVGAVALGSAARDVRARMLAAAKCLAAAVPPKRLYAPLPPLPFGVTFVRRHGQLVALTNSERETLQQH